jgi:hypothetical protein
MTSLLGSKLTSVSKNNPYFICSYFATFVHCGNRRSNKCEGGRQGLHHEVGGSNAETNALVSAIALLSLVGTGKAADHPFTGVGAGGLTTSSQPFLNGSNNPGRSGFSVPGQGSPLSGSGSHNANGRGRPAPYPPFHAAQSQCQSGQWRIAYASAISGRDDGSNGWRNALATLSSPAACANDTVGIKIVERDGRRSDDDNTGVRK